MRKLSQKAGPKIFRSEAQSLQSRYVFFAGLLALIIGVSIYFSYSDMRERYQNLYQNTKETSEFRKHILEMREQINSLVQGIDLVMLQPEYQEQVRLMFGANLTQIDLVLQRVLQYNLVRRYKLDKELEQLSNSLTDLEYITQRLIELRTNANQQYPSMAVSSSVMRPARNTVITILDTALREYHEEYDDNPQIEYHEAILNLKQLWTSTIAEYRLYLANRVGSFNEDQLFLQENNVNDYFEQVTLSAQRFMQFKDKFGFEGSELIPGVVEAIKQWGQGYEKVKEIHSSGDWRRDAEFMRVEVLPLLDRISSSLIEIDARVESANNNLIDSFGSIGKWQNTQLVIIAAVFIFYALVTFIFLRVLMFRPLSVLSNAIRSDELTERADDLRKLGRAKEINTLVEAFLSMHGQVIKRQEELTHHALHDALTGLPNRKLLMERLHHDIEISDRLSSPMAFLMLDLNGFKYVNDTLGHQIGDQLLIQVGQRLQKLLREADTIARLGGDEFSIILPEVAEDNAALVADKINAALENEFKVNDAVLHVGTSIGIAIYPEDGNNVHDLMKHADIAMYKSKQEKKKYHFYHPDDDENTLQRLSLTSDLRNAISENTFDLYYQPQLDVNTRTLSGVEVLLRWNHPQAGFVPPEKIIEIAENAAMIDDLTLAIIKKATRDGEVIKQYYPDINLAINLSVHNLNNESFFTRLQHLVEYAAFDSQDLIFEITEGSMMADPERSIDMLDKLTELGIKISVDDFGTGFSSLAYLKKLPVSELKIDRSFVSEMLEDKNDEVIVQSTIDLGHNLGLAVVAEGVENEQMLDRLRELNCDICQGYFFSRPLPFDELCDWIAKLNHTSGDSLTA